LLQQEDISMMPDMSWGWGGMILGPIMMIIILIAVVLLVRWLVNPGHSDAHPHKSPRDILEERYAKGEIDRQEFEERRRVLEQ
jgi:putative membrane protein